MDQVQLLGALAIAYGAAWLGHELLERAGQPGVVGEIAAGVVVGPAVFGVLPPTNDAFESLAELGVIFLLFTVGLEADLRELRRVGGTASAVAVGGVVVPFVLGFALMLALGHELLTAVFVATALVATSVGISARVLQERGVISTRAGRVILGAAVVDDILALLLIGGLAAATGGRFQARDLLLLVVGALSFVLVVGALGRRTIRNVIPAVRRMKMDEPTVGLAIVIALGLAASAARVGLAPLVGAFLAGLVLSELSPEDELERRMKTLGVFFVPFFFLHVGALVDSETFSVSTAGLAAVVTGVAVVGKLVGGALPAIRLGRRGALTVGVGMVPRGEVGIVVASLGLGLGVIDRQLYGVVVLMSILTSVLAPPVLDRLVSATSTET